MYVCLIVKQNDMYTYVYTLILQLIIYKYIAGEPGILYTMLSFLFFSALNTILYLQQKHPMWGQNYRSHIHNTERICINGHYISTQVK